MKDEKYLLTDGCMWEINKRVGDEHPHAIEVVDTETGAVRYIRSGAIITLVEGEITDIRTQEAYNKSTGQVSGNSKDKSNGTKRKRNSKEKNVTGL